MSRTLLAIALMLLGSAVARAEDYPRISAPVALHCLHPTGRYVRAIKIADQWQEAAIYGAERSEVDRIFFSGAISYHPYALDAAVIWRNGMVRIVVIEDTAPFPPNNRCALLNWNAPRAETASASARRSTAASHATKFGTGFFIDGRGTSLTAYHVVKGCKAIDYRSDGQAIPASLVAFDEKNDLAVVRGKLADISYVKFDSDEQSIRPADEVIAAGYPYTGLLASAPEITTGTVTALAGIGNDSRFVQISAPIQPGNSGGPLFDLSGTVVGIVVSTLSPLKIAMVTGSLPQNVNFAVKGTVIREFLKANQIAYQTAQRGRNLDPADVAQAAMKAVAIVECLN